MSKLDKNQRIRTSKPKQDFDLSHDFLFTATTRGNYENQLKLDYRSTQ